MPKRPLLICLDVEPEYREVALDDSVAWDGVTESVELFQSLRPQFQKATGGPVHFSWFVRMDPQIERAYGSADWGFQRYEKLFRLLQAEGDEIGLHVHPWRWSEDERRWIADFSDQAWVEHCVRMGFEAFARCFGRPCKSFRFGDHWLNDATVALQEQLGLEIDLTVEPGKTGGELHGPVAGFMPDYSKAPRHPYHPNAQDFTRAGSGPQRRRLRMLPLSTADVNALSSQPRSVPRLHQPSLIDRLSSRFVGYLDIADNRQLAGWIYDRKNPNEPVSVDILIDDRLCATITANQLRLDLQKAGKGDGRHGFNFFIPARLRDDREHVAKVQVAGTSIALKNSPRSVVWPRNMPPVFQTLDLAFSAPQLQAGFDQLLYENDSPYIAFVARTSIGVDPHRAEKAEAVLQYLLRHPRLGEFAFDTPAEALRRLEAETVIAGEGKRTGAFDRDAA